MSTPTVCGRLGRCLGLLPVTLSIVALGSCSIFDDSGSSGSGRPERFERLGAYRRSVSAQDEEARFWFDQGLLWTYGFNHDEAVRSFREAQRIDPGFALAYWGEGFALGPNINAPLVDRNIAVRAYEASREALARLENASEVEKALIEALAQRYADPADLDIENSDQRSKLDTAYAEAMSGVYLQFPEDPDVAALYADARMNQRPWDYWSDDGLPQPGIESALEALRTTVAEHPDHPGAHHFLIHATESSPNPAEGIPSAEALRTLAPGSGHLVHMPAHTFQRVGRYYEAETSNREAVRVDRAYLARVGPQGIYEGYRAHNHHFLAWSAMYGGRFEAALAASRDLVSDLPDEFRAHPGPLEGFLPIELHVLVRFGRWDAILEFPAYPEDFHVSTATRHYARGIAHAARGEVAAARREQVLFLAALGKLPEGAVIGINPAAPVLAVAEAMLEGEIYYRQGRFDEAFAELGRAVELEDALRYDEPSGWMTPVRHAVGALALEQGRTELAESAYREDLRQHPENGWALHGLAECLRAQGQTEEAEAVMERFRAAWAHADTPLSNGSCFCRQKVAGGPDCRAPTETVAAGSAAPNPARRSSLASR